MQNIKLNEQEVKARTDVTTKFANVSQESLTTSSEYLTAIWNNFAKGAKNLEYFADVVVALGAATASSSQEIATGLNKFAATAETVGLSYEYATAALATVTATTRQSADVVGTAFKTLFARIQDLELGKTLDDGTTLGKYSKALDAVGISIKESNGELKDMDTILDEMGDKWQDLGKAEQVALAQAVGGVRQYTQLIALMDNWDFMKENLDTAYNATGALQEQADIFAESWEAARKSVKTSTEGLASSLIDEDFWIDATKGLSVFIDELKLVVDSIGGLRGVIALGVVAMNKLVGPKIAQNIRDLAFNIGVLTGKEREHTQALKQSALQVIESYAKSKGNFALDQNQVLFYKDMGNYQLKVNELMKGFTSEQEEAVKNQLALVKATQDLAIAMAQSHEQARNNSDDFLVGSEDALTPSPYVHWTEQMGGRNFLRVEKNRWSNGNDFLRGVEENAAQREMLTGASQLMRTGKWKDNKQQLLTMLGMDAKTTKKDFQTELQARIKAANEEYKKLQRESGFMTSNDLRQFGTADEIFNNAVNMGAQRGNAKVQQVGAALDAKGAQDTALKNIPLLSAEVDDFASRIVGVGSALSNLSIAWSSFQSLGRVFTDEDMEAGDRIQTLFMSLGMLLPTLSSGLKQTTNLLSKTKLVTDLQEGIGKFDKDTKAFIAPTQGNAGLKQTIAASIAKKDLAKATKGSTAALSEEAIASLKANAALKAGVATIGIYVAIAAALAAAIWIAAENIETQKEKTAALNEQYSTLKERYESVKSTTDELTSSLETLSEHQTSLAGLTKGTQEWKDAVKDVNSEILELINKYPQLAKYVESSNGVLKLSAQGQREAIAAQREELYAAQRNMNIAALTKNADELKRLKNSYRDIFKIEQSWGTAGNRVGGGAGTSTGAYQASALTKDDSSKLIDAIQKSGSWILNSTSELAKLGFTTDAQIQAIQGNSAKILELSSKVEANTQATAALVSAMLEEEFDAAGVPESVRDSLSNLYANNMEDYQSEHIADNYGLAKLYAEANPDVISARKAAVKNGIVVTYQNDDGVTEEKYIPNSAANAFVQQNASQENFVEKYGEVAKNLYNQFGEELTNALIDYAGGNLNVNDLDPETYNKLKDLGSDALQQIVASLGQGAKEGLDSQLQGYNETYHNRIKYLGSDLGGKLNERDNILSEIATLQVQLGDYNKNSEEYNELQNKINNLVASLSKNADDIKLSINSSLREDVDEAFEVGKSFKDLQKRLADGLEMTTDDVIDLIDSGYGALLRNCEATADGLISINQSVADEFVEQKKQEVEADRQAKIAQLKTQRELLVMQQQALEEKQRLLKAAADARSPELAAEYLAEAMMQQAIADDYAEQAAAVIGMDQEKSIVLSENAQSVADYVNSTLDATSNSAIDNNIAISDSTYDLCKNVVEYWNKMTAAKAAYCNVTEDNAKQYLNGTNVDPGTKGSMPTTKVSTDKVDAFDSSSLKSEEDWRGQIDKWKAGILERAEGNAQAIRDAASSMLKDTDLELKTVLGQIGAIDAAIARISGNLLDSVVGGKDKNKGSSSAKETEKDLKEVLERYHEITREIEYQKELLEDIGNMADRAYGTDKVELLTQKIEKLNKVAGLQQEKQAAAAAYVLADLEALRANGMNVVYDSASYELKNYTQLLNQITDEYNSRINSVSDEQRDAVQKEYDTKMKLLENYEDSIDTFRDQLNEYEDTMREIEDAKLAKIEATFQIRLDWKEFRDTLREFDREVNNSIGDALNQSLDSILIDEQGIKDQIEMFEDYKTKANALLDMIRNANEYTDVQTLQENLADLRSELVDNGSEMLDYVNTLKELLPNAIDAASARFEEFISLLENGQNTLSAINDLVELQTINYSLTKRYELLGESYNATLENAFTQAKLQKQYMERAETELKEAEVALANAIEGTAEYDILKANRDALLGEFQQAQDAMLSATATAMEAARTLFSNTLDDIFYEFESKLTKGLGYDQLQAKYDRTKDEDNRFLDGVNRFVETQNLNNKLQESISNASSDYAKATLKALEEEFAERQANADLSEYDLKIMEAKYQMTLKQIALEEAQNAKTKVRLVRGANGNYNYLFTADNNDIMSKQQEYLKSMQDYYNIAKDQTENITGEIVSLWKDMSDEIRKIYEDDTLNAEQRQNAINEIQNYYQKKYEDLAKMQKDAAKDMTDAGDIVLKDQQKAASKYGDDTSEVAQNFQKNFQRILEEMGGNADEFNSEYSQQLINLVALEGSFTEMTAQLFSQLNEALNTYKGNISNISNSIGVTYDQLRSRIDLVSEANERLQEKATTAIDEIWNKIDEIQDVSQAQAEWTSAIYDTISAMQKLASETATAVQKYNEAISNIQRLQATGQYTNDSLSSATNGMNSGSSGKYNTGGTSTGSGSTRVREQLGQFPYDSATFKNLTSAGAVYEGGGWWNYDSASAAKIKRIAASYKFSNSSGSNVSGGGVNRVSRFDTGGYTGDWGNSEGRVAVLHQKELVLNQEDTKNILSAVQSIRDLTPTMIADMRQRLMGSALASKNLFGSRFNGSNTSFSREATRLEQAVNINADFPGVRDAIEIKEALESLVQTSAQRINFYTK